ncbi:MAG: DegV family protein [Lachnospiraceae bacterium]|nr:DegV family protein [Lachnospiraceae bacterium]
MPDVAIVTDSNSGITQSEGKKLGIYVLPMPFFIEEELHYEDIDFTQEKFYELLNQDINVSTSQPTPADVTGLWKEILKEYQQLVYIPMSSGLSTSCDTARALARDYEGRVFVVDNKRISVTMRQSVLDALVLSRQGLSGAQIKELLEKTGMDASIYLLVDTLKFLKKGGRITPAAAMIGSVLRIKPILTIQGDKLDAFAKVRGTRQGKKIMLDAMQKDMEERFAKERAAGQMALEISYSYGQDEIVDQWRSEVQAGFPDMTLDESPLSLSVACHTGPGVLAIACAKKVSDVK